MKKNDLIKYGLQGFLCGLGLGGAIAFTLAIGQSGSKMLFDLNSFYNMVLIFCPILAGWCTWEIIQENQK